MNKHYFVHSVKKANKCNTFSVVLSRYKRHFVRYFYSMANKENIPLYIKNKFSELNKADQSLKSIFDVIHNQDERIFCEYLDAFSIKDVPYSLLRIM